MLEEESSPKPTKESLMQRFKDACNANNVESRKFNILNNTDDSFWSITDSIGIIRIYKTQQQKYFIIKSILGKSNDYDYHLSESEYNELESIYKNVGEKKVSTPTKEDLIQLFKDGCKSLMNIEIRSMWQKQYNTNGWEVDDKNGRTRIEKRQRNVTANLPLEFTITRWSKTNPVIEFNLSEAEYNELEAAYKNVGK